MSEKLNKRAIKPKILKLQISGMTLAEGEKFVEDFNKGMERELVKLNLDPKGIRIYMKKEVK